MNSLYKPSAFQLYSLVLFSGVILLIIFLNLVPGTLIPLIISLTLAHLFDPLIDRIQEKGYERQKIVFWFFLLIAFVIAALILFIMPYLFLQIVDFLNQIPEWTVKLINFISLKTNLDTSQFKEKIISFISENNGLNIFPKIALALKETFEKTAHFFMTIMSCMIIPIFFYYLLLYIDDIKNYLYKFIPSNHRLFFISRLKKTEMILNGFFRGQLAVCFALGCLYAIGLSIAGIKYSLLIGFLTGLFNIVPYLGVGLGFCSSFLIAFTMPDPMIKLIMVVIVFGFVQAFEGFYLTPRLVGNKVGLGSFTTLLAILIGSEIGGLSGMIISVPVAGFIRVYSRDLSAIYFKSQFFKNRNA